METSSVTTWVQGLRAGNQAAATSLWKRYYSELVRLCRNHLSQRVRKAGDEEDVALMAFASFCNGIAEGRFPSIANREDLWRMLFTIAIRKAKDHARHEDRERRRGPTVSIDFLDFSDADLACLISSEPNPAWAAEMADQLRHLMASLPDDKLRNIAQAILEGFNNEDTAERLGLSLRQVERKRQVIRKFWLEHHED